MTSEQWRAVVRIVDSARVLPVAERKRFVASETSDPEVVRRVVELLDAPADEELFVPATVDRTGTHLGRYEIAELLGRGGMGEVYAAQDTELGRPVALKFLTAGAGDPIAIRRFIREAKAASALNHPNILTVYEVIQSASGMAIAMELVEGEPLSQFRGAALPIAEVAGLGRQVASALSVAHDHGIVHRDIKPENLMLRPDGVVKILDFGLAHDFAGQLAATLQPSGTGLPAGTLRYMSPEQLRGKPVTGASDVFSLGIVLYEQAVGRHPFESEYAWETAYAIHKFEPTPPSAVNRDVPAWLDELILSMLQRDPAARPQAQQIESSLASPGRMRSSGRRSRAVRARFLRRAAWAVPVIALAAYAWSSLRNLPGGGPLHVLPLATFAGSKGYPALSPSGKYLAFSWQAPGSRVSHIYVKPVDEGDPVQMTFAPYDDVLPAWSPDGKQVAFSRQPNGDSGPQEIYIVPAAGGKERKITEAWKGLSWSVDGKFLALVHLPNAAAKSSLNSGGVFLLSLESGQTRDLTSLHLDSYPVFSPDGKWITFRRQVSPTMSSIFVIPANGGSERQLTFKSDPYAIRAPAWTTNSREILFSSLRTGANGSLWRVPVAGGKPRPVSATLRDASDPNISRQGYLAYHEAWNDTNLYLLTAKDFSGDLPAGFGDPLSVVNASREDHSPAFSPDGERIAFVSDRSGYQEIWVARRDGSKAVQLTSLQAQNTGSPRWSPDGRRIAFDSWASGRSAVYVVDSTGGSPRILTTGALASWMPYWSPDGQWIFCSRGESDPSEIWKIPVAGGDAVQLTHSGGIESRPSPDGSLIYYSKRLSQVDERGIWTVPVGGGVEKRVPELEKFRRIGRSWGVIDQGIYFVSYEDVPQQSVRLLSFRTRKVTSLFTLQKQRHWGVASLTFSRDGHYALATQLDHEVNDLMMIENFR